MVEVEVRPVCAAHDSPRCNDRCTVPVIVATPALDRVVFRPCGTLWHQMKPARGDGLEHVRVCICGALYEAAVCDECAPAGVRA